MEDDLHEQRLPQAGLPHALRTVGIPFVASPFGRWARFERDGKPVYLVSDAWGTGCCLMSMDEGGTRESQHFLSMEAALAEVAWMTGMRQSAASTEVSDRLETMVDSGMPAA